MAGARRITSMVIVVREGSCSSVSYSRLASGPREDDLQIVGQDYKSMKQPADFRRALESPFACVGKQVGVYAWIVWKVQRLISSV